MSTNGATAADRQAPTKRNGLGTLLGLAALVSLASAVGCETERNAPMANPTATSRSTSQAKEKETNVSPPPSTAKAADPTPPPATAQTADPAPQAGCRSLWTEPAERLVLRNQSGNGAYYREFEYVRATRTLRVDDSDLYDKNKSGKELETPRITKESKVLTVDEARELEGAFAKACFTKDELDRRCAPGGCARMTVYARGGEAFVEHGDSMPELRKRMSAHFPALRN